MEIKIASVLLSDQKIGEHLGPLPPRSPPQKKNNIKIIAEDYKIKVSVHVEEEVKKWSEKTNPPIPFLAALATTAISKDG